MIATVNLNFAIDIAPVFHVIPKGYDISNSSAIFELRDKNGAELYPESSAGITVETITLTAPLKYADGTEIAAGAEVDALRVAPDLSPLSLGDPIHVNAVQYRYGLRIDDAWVMQGWVTVWPDTGPAGCMGSPIAVCCGPQQIAVGVAGVSGSGGAISKIISSFNFADMAVPVSLGLPSPALLTDIRLLITDEPFDVPLWIGYADNPDFFCTIPAGKTGDLRWRPFQAAAEEIILSSPSSPAAGSGSIIILSI